MKRVALLTMVLVLVWVPILACDLPLGKKEAPTATPEPTPAPTATVRVAVKPSPTPTKPKPTATPLPTPTKPKSTPTRVAREPTATPEEEEAATIAARPENIQTYRSRTVMPWEGEKDSGSLSLLTEFVREPLAESVVISVAGSMGGMLGEGMPAGELELIRIGDTTWVGMDGQWMQVASEDAEELPTGGLFVTKDTVGDLSKARRVLPDQTVSGIKCRHYVFDEKALGADLTEGLTEVGSVQANAWVAAKEGYLVKLDAKIEGEWQEPVQGKGTLSMLFEIYDLNKPFSIEPPTTEGGKAAGLPEDIPLMPDAKVQAAMPGLIAYNTESSVKEVAAFYQKEMPTQGWKQSGETTIIENVAMLAFEKTGRELSIMVSIDDKTGATGVVITGGQ